MNTFLIFANILQLLSDTVFFTLYSLFTANNTSFLLTAMMLVLSIKF